jgi:hypothetical protein
MRNLESLLQGFARRSLARWWLGARPDGRDSHMTRIIAAKVGYPTAAPDPFARNGFVGLDRSQAAHVLAVAGTTSLAYGRPVPREGDRKEAAEALRDLGEGASFFSNGVWQGESHGWRPLTSATFDCGVIGYDDRNAFIFWVEEED